MEYTVRDQVSSLLSVSDASPFEAHAGNETIEVSPATQRIAHAYERFRNTLEPDEEDILRRKAIFRVLERRLLDDRSPHVKAEQILQELIRARYIDVVPRTFVAELAVRLVRAQTVSVVIAPEYREWFMKIVAVAIDRDLFPRPKEEALTQLMYQDTFARAQWVGSFVEEEERTTQLYIACHRALFHADDMEITYDYFIRHFPQWDQRELSDADLNIFAREVPRFFATISHALQHADRERLTRLLKPVAVPYRMIYDLMGKPEAFGSRDSLEANVREAMGKRIQKLRTRMNKRAWNSILFLLFTKTILAFLIEVPYEVFLARNFHKGALVVNIFFHPLLLLGLATTVRMPGSANTQKVIESVDVIVSGDGTLPTVVLRASRRYGALTWALLATFYSVFFLMMFWLLFWALAALGFSLVAMFMFVLFLGLVSFLAIRIRRSVSEVAMVVRREGAMATLLSFLSLPILEFGRWLALHVRQLNIPLLFMDRILEAPFKILMDVVEEWFTFVRERRDEIA